MEVHLTWAGNNLSQHEIFWQVMLVFDTFQPDFGTFSFHTASWITLLCLQAIWTHHKTTFRTRPVDVEQRRVTGVAHFTNTRHWSFPRHFSCHGEGSTIFINVGEGLSNSSISRGLHTCFQFSQVGNVTLSYKTSNNTKITQSGKWLTVVTRLKTFEIFFVQKLSTDMTEEYEKDTKNLYENNLKKQQRKILTTFTPYCGPPKKEQT